MHRLDSSTVHAALRYQHMRGERDRLIADAMDAGINKAQGDGFWRVTGTAVIR